MKTIETLDVSPFRRLISTIGEIPTSFVESMTYYELLAWFCDYLKNKVTPAVNNNAEALKELEEFVVNYFDSQDFQQMVNDKLDEMATDGTLENLINQEIFGELNGKVDANTLAIAGLQDDVSDLTDEVEAKMDFANVGNLVQNFIYDDTVAAQGCCYDSVNDVLYVFEPGSDNVNGKLKKFSLANHTYLGEISNVPFYHGNDLAFLDGVIYASAFYTSDLQATNKTLIKYNISTSVSETLNPFTGYDYARTFGVTPLDSDNLIVGMSATSNRDVSEVHFLKYNLTDSTVTELTINFNGYRVNASLALCGIQYVDGKLYLLTNQDHQIFEFEVGENSVLLNKVYRMPNYSEEGLYLGEMEGLAAIPSANGKSFAVISTLIFEGEYSFMCHELNLETNLVPYLTSRVGSVLGDNISEIHVKSTFDGSTLLEDGSNDRPFKKLNRAIDYQNKFNVKDIYIDDGEYYKVGSPVRKRLSIRWTSSVSPTIEIGELVDCECYIRSNARSGLIVAKNNHQFQIKGGYTIIDFTNLKAQISTTGYARVFIDNATSNLEDSAARAVDMIKGTGQIRFTSIDNYTASKPIRIEQGSFAVLGSSLASLYDTASGGVVIVEGS